MWEMPFSCYESLSKGYNVQMSLCLTLTGDVYSPRNDPDPEMIPNPEMTPNRPQNNTDPKMIPISLHVDPEMILN